MSFSSFIAFDKPTRRAKRWLRRLFYDDWSLKLLALAITLLLWFVVTGHDRQIERELIVEPHITGTPAPGYEVRQVLAAPDKIRVQGPEDHVNALHKASTKTISVDGRSDSFDVASAPVEISDPNVDSHDTVNVHVEIVPLVDSKSKSRDTN